jgi:hypothetical protein
VVAEVEPCFSFSDEQRKDRWFARSDYHFSRQSARVIAKESERYGHSKHLEGVYTSAFSQQAQDMLNLWSLHGHSRRGLERWANSRHGRIRKEDQQMYEQGILRAQQELKLKNEGDKNAQAERLREVSLVLSRKSRLFAQMMGEADANATASDRTAYTKDISVNETMKHIQAAVRATGHAHYSPSGTIPMFGRLPSQQQPRRNLGLGGPIPATMPQRKVNRVADLPSRAVAPQFGGQGGAGGVPSSLGAGLTPRITIKSRTAGRVPRMA